MDPSDHKQRIIGFDVARALAVFGMVVVNFVVVMGAEANGPQWLQRMVGVLEGRAAATFVVLAGVGLSLLSQKARLLNDAAGVGQHRATLAKRALFLLIVGLLFVPIWPPDILHFYGIYIAIGVCFLASSDRTLWKLALGSGFGFVFLLFLFDYDAGWDWETLEYLDFWTVQGMVRHLFFNGFHPVIPWVAFLFVGMWLGRQDLLDTAVRKRLLIYGAGVFMVSETISWLLTMGVMEVVPEAELIDALALVASQPLPPMPFYLLSAGGVAIIVILLSIMLSHKYPVSVVVKALVATGQLALTLYVAHVIVGMGILEALGRLENQSLAFAVMSALIFVLSSVVFSVLWRKRFARGPLEFVMRRMT
jgi:uncharacterized membrane protein YeiB